MTWLQTLWAAWQRRGIPPHSQTLVQLKVLMAPKPRMVVQLRVLRRPESRQRKEA